MTTIKSILGLTAASSIFLWANISAQTQDMVSPKEMDKRTVQAKCQNMKVLKINGQYQCQTQDNIVGANIDRIIADMQKHDLSTNPIQAGNEGDRRALRHLPDASLSAHLASSRFSRSLLNRYKAVDASGLHGENKLNYQLLGYVLEQRLAFADYDTSRLSFTNDSGFFNMMSYVSRQTKFKTIDDYEAYADRLSELPRYFDQHQTNMRRGIRTKYTASDEILPGIIAAVKALSSGEPQDHAFYSPFSSYPDSISEADQKRLTALGKETISKYVLAAYGGLLDFFENDYAPNARTQVGIGTNKLNRDYYKALVKHFTTLDLTPDQVHDMGLAEVKRIRAEMNDIIKKTEFEGSFKEFLVFLRTDPQFYAETADDLLKEAAWIAKRIDGQMPKYFGQLPRLSYGVMPVPDEMAANYTTGRYWSGSLANGIAGNYVVNTYDLSQRPLYNLPSLTLHEGVPGHHHQISLAQELKDVPEFRKNLYPNAFGEGWGLYAEKLGVEMGIYRTDYENFGRLTYEMWRACRLVVDTGMHWKGWSRAQAEACFFDNTALAPHNIRTEVERYISWPGQALAYKIGEMKILELRKKAKAELGDEFDIRGFHDAVLGNGGIPLTILDEQITNWISTTKSGQ